MSEVEIRGAFPGSLLCCLPVLAQFLVEVVPAFFREENPCALELHATLRTGSVVGEPARPFHVEIHIVCSPDDQGWRSEVLQPCFNGERVFIVERRKKAFEVAYSLLAS